MKKKTTIKHSKRIISAILTLTMLVGIVCCAPFAVSATESAAESVGASSGTTGDCTWTLDDSGTLTVSGNGKMADYEYTEVKETESGDYEYKTTAPWWNRIK